MDLFIYEDKDTFSGGISVSGYLTASWIERYRTPGEFTITAKVSSGIMSQLPIGGFLSRLDSFEVMKIEDHYIKDDEADDPIVEITGRSLEVLFTDRVIGAAESFASGYREYAPYILSAAGTGTQARNLLRDFSQPGLATNADDEMPGTAAYTSLGGSVSEEREIRRGNVHSKVLEILAIENLGLRVVRKHTFSSPLGGPLVSTRFWVHEGNDVSQTVEFSADTGSLSISDYLWSSRNTKNVALVSGQGLEVLVELDSPSKEGYERKIMLVDAGDIDRTYDPVDTTGPERDAMIQKMQERGKEALAAQRGTAITSVKVPEVDIPGFAYRTDYDIGDIVNVRGNYGEATTMRVIEYAEFEDENKREAYPTLAEP